MCLPSLAAQVVQHPSLLGTILSQLFGSIEGHRIGSHCITQSLLGYIHFEQFCVNALAIGWHTPSESLQSMYKTTSMAGYIVYIHSLIRKSLTPHVQFTLNYVLYSHG